MKKLKFLSQRLVIKMLDKSAKLLASLAIHMCSLSSWLSSLSNRLFERMWYQEAAISESPKSVENGQYYVIWNPSGFFETRITPFEPLRQSSRQSDGGTITTPKPPATRKPTKPKSKPRTRKSKGAKLRQKRAK